MTEQLERNQKEKLYKDTRDWRVLCTPVLYKMEMMTEEEEWQEIAALSHGGENHCKQKDILGEAYQVLIPKYEDSVTLCTTATATKVKGKVDQR